LKKKQPKQNYKKSLIHLWSNETGFFSIIFDYFHQGIFF